MRARLGAWTCPSSQTAKCFIGSTSAGDHWPVVDWSESPPATGSDQLHY